MELSDSLLARLLEPLSPPLVPVLRSRATAEDGGADKGEGGRSLEVLGQALEEFWGGTMDENVLREGISIRFALPSDHPKIISVMPEWWDGRDLTSGLQRLFLVHFHDTSLVAEKDGEFIGFLVGFLSQSRRDEGYIHFVGVNPKYRKKGLGAALYNLFFSICQEHSRNVVRSCTSPVNKGSVAFHRKMGFMIEPGDDVVDGIPVTLDYNRPNDPKVLFTRYL
jgi:predicted GNAT superfamily acetyltransferase